MSNREAIDAVVAVLETLGRLEAVDAAVVEIARSLADAVDVDKGNAALWREFRAAEETLRGLSGGSDDSFAEFVDRFRVSS